MRKGLKILLIICFLLVCFSRCYLGVHTPADVICAIISSLIILIIIRKVFDKYGDNPNMDLIIAGAGILISILLMVYAVTKSYPMDYDAAGKLIVDPAEMMLDAFKDAGLGIGISLSWIIERRFIKFTSDGNLESKIMRFIAGFIGYEIILTVIYPILKNCCIPEVGKFLGYMIFPIYIMIIVPIIIKFFQNRSKKKLDYETNP
ncbi:phosphatase PAP2 family protein [Methanobrevibacter sp.]|uniref:phosphatase PAP2 family protein n=1 Tax=Methanobrevibacter sp. TaxID=66852 RepID=UPI0025E87BC9|nr:phosphatase PAP2 family protein [Methanobrevibacter sp.]